MLYNRTPDFLLEVGVQDIQVAPPVQNWAQTSKTDRMAYVMRRLVQNYGFPVNGAAGLVGNLYAESELIPNRIEGSSANAPMRARDFNDRITDFSALQIMNRNYQARQGPKLPGVGLAQWTSSSRRIGLFNHSYGGRRLGEAILFEMDAQIDYLVNELRTQYGQVNNLLRNPTLSVDAASDEVVYSFEIPGAILEAGKRLPRNDPRVQEVFKKRRAHSREALASYQRSPQPAGLPPLGPLPSQTPVSGGVNPAVNTPLSASGPGFYSTKPQSRRYGTSAMVRALMSIAARWQQAFPNGPRIGFGDLSFQGGGKMPPHVSHDKGVDVDIRLVRADGQEKPTRYQDPSYSRAGTKKLIDLILANGVLPVKFILFNDPQVIGGRVKHWRGHDDHLHVRFVLSPSPGAGPGEGPSLPGRPSRAPGADGMLGFLTTLLGIPGAIVDLLQRGQEHLAVRTAIARGLSEENKLTNMVFFARHPDRAGKKIVRGEPQFDTLSREWLQIRDRLVRPALRDPQQSRTTGPITQKPLPQSSLPQPKPARPGAIPPTEGPYKGMLSKPCEQGGGRCWTRRVLDIVDPDAPWNTPDRRSPANYIAVLEYLNVENRSNFRYARTREGSTFCNIYLHDATRMMWASIPHWVPDRRSKNGFRELNANATQDWMEANSRSIGWVEVDDRFCRWIQEQFNRRQKLPFDDPTVPVAVLAAGSRVATGNHADPSLLAQPSYITQQFANLGMPAVIIWKNLVKKCKSKKTDKPTYCSGHVAMVRPETAGNLGKVHTRTKVFVPRSAQAGKYNYSNGHAEFIINWLDKPNKAKFYIHA